MEANNSPKLKLNYGRTLLVGLAFLSICAFWQMYDFVVPLILRDTYGLPDGPAGIVMSVDNVIALFLLPLFGALSDKAKGRMPFIVIGTAVAVCVMMGLPLLDNGYTAMDPMTSLILFFVTLGVLLLTMASYRSPAVALMASVTPKPLRSKGNAVINLMGAVGGLFTLLAISAAVVENGNGTGRANYTYLFVAVAALMAVSVIALVCTVREKKLVAQMEAINYGVPESEDQGKQEVVDGKAKLPKPVKVSLILILAAIALWFFGYNAITTAFSKYATQVWGTNAAGAASCLMIATVAAVISYIPIGFLSSRFGRKRMIQGGLILAVLCFVTGAVMGETYSQWVMWPMFVLVGFAQAAITVNTFPMVWEISRVGNVGKYTGYYYTCSMAAQVLTPILSGYLLQYVGYWTLFPYGALMVALAIIPISLAKHGDSKPERKKSKLEELDTPD